MHVESQDTCLAANLASRNPQIYTNQPVRRYPGSMGGLAGLHGQTTRFGQHAGCSAARQTDISQEKKCRSEANSLPSARRGLEAESGGSVISVLQKGSLVPEAKGSSVIYVFRYCYIIRSRSLHNTKVKFCTVKWRLAWRPRGSNFWFH